MQGRDLVAALMRGDELEIAAALGWASIDRNWPQKLHAFRREAAMALVERGGPMTRLVLTSHPDGRVRESALRALEPDAAASLPGVLARANDWVPVVARLAGERATRLLPHAGADILAEGLPLVFALTRQGRVDHRALVEAYRRAVGRHPGLAARLRRANGSGPVGRWAFRSLIGDDETPQAVAREGLRNPQGGVGLEAARLLAQDPAAWPELVASRHPAIRRMGLDIAPEEAREAALLDPNAGVRNDARYLLGKRDYASFYRARLPDPAAVSGLGETGSAADAELLRPLLEHPKTEVRRRALVAFARLANERAIPDLIAALKVPNRRVQRAAVEALGRMVFALDPEEAASLDLAPFAAWALMDRTPRWTALIAVLRRVETFPRADAWLARWAERSRMPIPPTFAEAADATALLAEARASLRPETHDAVRAAIRAWVR